ncbi:MAG: alanine racemase [Streptococcaceae bacterium]|nr:alanine racemase [Streptococcaceae bacterium]
MKASPHRHTPAIIHLQAIRNNIEHYKHFIDKQPEIWAVVKANAYGHGAVKVAQAVASHVQGFCISNLDEALELRNNDITLPLLVLSGIVPDNADLARDMDITLTVPSVEWLELVIKESTTDLSGLKVHVAVDTGMGRIGVKTTEEINEIYRLAEQHCIEIEGIFTHFATADEKDTDKLQEQSEKFEDILSKLPYRPRYIHSTNSAAGLWHSNQVQDIERLGIAMYGLNPSGTLIDLPYQLEPALTLQSEITHMKKIEAGETVGYGATFEASEETYIGTVSIGYADGWTREMQGFHVLIDGQEAEIVGRISMDQMTIKCDKYYPIGTLVTLIGRDGDREITVDDIAKWRKTINYEIICLLSDRIYRIYK